MNPNHQKFINEYLATGDKITAYRKAYPKAKEASLTNAVNRLMQREDVSSIINKTEERAFKKAEAALEKRVQADLLDLYEMQLLLTQIARGQHTTTKPVKENGSWTTIDVKPTHNMILRAINTFFRLKSNSKAQPENAKRTQLKSIEVPDSNEGGNIPPDPARSIYPHPFGNVYPPTYPGPYYDPGDPNTKEKLQKLRFDRIPKEETTESMQLARPTGLSETQQSKTSPPSGGGVAEGRGGGIQHRQATTTPVPLIAVNNKPQQSKTSHPFGGGVASRMLSGRGCGTQQEQTPTIQNPGKEQQKTTNQPLPATRFSPRVQQMLLRDQLRKEGWQTVEEAGNEVYETFIRNQCSQNYKMLKQFEKLRAARNLPPEERGLIEKETGWVYHPQHSFMVKRKRR